MEPLSPFREPPSPPLEQSSLSNLESAFLALKGETESDLAYPDVGTRALQHLHLAANEPTAKEYAPLWQWNKSNKRSRESDGILDKWWAGLLPGWLNWCVTHHEECSRRELDSVFGDAEDILLIDTGRLCLVKAQTNYRYIALSYVWGPNPHFTTLTTTGSVEKFLEPESLLDIWDKLPRVVQEAIDLTDRIGERFLWVDFLCIIQDHGHHLGLGRQLKLMAEIYNSAPATFVACAGDHADVRLVPSKLSPALPGTEKLWMNGHSLYPYRPKLAEAKGFLAAISASTHSRRGWTYQEKLLSRRCLYFLPDRIIYRCRADMFDHNGEDEVTMEIPPGKLWSTMTFMEDAIDAAEEDYKYFQAVADRARRRRFLSEWPRDMIRTDWDRGFKFWADIIQEYSQKQFTFETDVLDACSGVLTAFQRYSGWHIFQGCPEPLLDYALLWVPRPGGEARTFATMRSPIPSWSWLGWRGGVLFDLALHENKLWECQSRLHYCSTFERYAVSECGRSSSPQGDADAPEAEGGFNDTTEATHLSGLSLRFVAESVPASIFLHDENEDLSAGDVSPAFTQSIWLSCSDSSPICGIMYGVSRDAFRLLEEESTNDQLWFILLSDLRLTRFRSVNWKLAFESFEKDLRKQEE